MDPLQLFFRNVESETFWRQLAPWLRVNDPHTLDPTASTERPVAPNPRESSAPHWTSAGYVHLPALLDPPTTASLARAVVALRARHLHPTFLYVYDESWHTLDALRQRLTPLLGDGFEALADVWAFHVDPTRDRGGWPIHRGWYEDVRDATGTPALVNVWVALTDATERNACMHVVPLSRDPHYPADLHDLTGLEDLALPLPVAAGSALVWDANVAHSGGTCDPSFLGPRISISFTLQRHGSVATDNYIPELPLPFRARLDLIAQQFETYGDRELSPDCNEMRWAKLLHGMRQAARHRAPPARSA